MAIEEIQELMALRGWSKAGLAAALDVSEHAVYKWLHAGKRPGGPASILMRQWLDESRKPNGHAKRKAASA